MDQQQMSKWEGTRRRGMWRFVVVWTLALGAAMITATALFDYFTNDASRSVLQNMKIRAPIFLISAFISGLALWFVGQRMYRKSSGKGGF